MMKMKIRFKTIISLVPSIVFLFFMYYMMIRTGIDLASESEISSVDFSALEDVLQDDIYSKNNYINLNGLIEKTLGINSLNDTQKLASGHLTVFSSAADTTSDSNSTIELNEFLTERGIDFLYVLVPSKSAFYDAEFAPGYSSDAWMSIDTMIDALNEAGVNNIDMDSWYEENGWGMDDVFFVTDHHWKPEAAFAATHEMLLFMEENFGIEYDDTMANFDVWTIDNYESFYLGAYGRRVGIYYDGTDDINIIYREDQSEVEFSGLSQNKTSWIYRDSVIDSSLLTFTDYFESNSYCAYMGGNYGQCYVKNDNALNDLKILVIGDSFRLPVETFLSSYFSELYHVDLRYYTDGTLAQYIEEIQPDIVLMCANVGNFSSEIYEFGVEEYKTCLEEQPEIVETVEIGSISIESISDDNNNFAVVCSNLEPGKTYTIMLPPT